MIKVLIVGTSNSLVKNGWVSGLNNFHNMEVYNLSIGGCCSVQHIERMLSHQGKIMESDIIILDSFVNDLIFDMSGQIEKNNLLEYISAMYSIASSSCKPVISLLFPTLHHLGSIENNFIYQHHLSECRKNNISVIDFFEICKDIEFRHLCFLDGPHISPNFAFWVGEAIGRFCLERISNNKNKVHISKISGGYEYKVLDLVKNRTDLEIVSKENSRFSEKLIHLDRRINISHNGCYLLGVLQWSERASGSLNYRVGGLVNKFESSGGLLKFSPTKKPVLLDTTLSFIPSEHCERFLVSKVLLRKRIDVNSENLINSKVPSEMDISCLTLELKKIFSIFMSGVRSSSENIKKITNLEGERLKNELGALLSS